MGDVNVIGFNHVAIWVKDMKASSVWYKEKLGMVEASVGGNHIFMKSSNGQVLALFETSDEDKIGKLHHIAFDDPSKESSLECLKSQGVELKKFGPNDGFEDPDGYHLHL